MTRIDDEIVAYPDGIPLAPTPPGDTLAAELAARGLTAHQAAMKMRIPSNRLGAILKGKRAISADTALRLAELLGPSARFWMTLQAQYDLACAQQEKGARIAAEVEAA